MTSDERATFGRNAPTCAVWRAKAAADSAIKYWGGQCHPDRLHGPVGVAVDLEIIATPGWERLIGRETAARSGPEQRGRPGQ